MASRRELKKLVNRQCFKVTGECFTFLEHTPSLNQENVQLIISHAMDLRNRLIYQLSNPPSASAPDADKRGYYRNIRTELLKGTRELTMKLNSLPR